MALVLVLVLVLVVVVLVVVVEGAPGWDLRDPPRRYERPVLPCSALRRSNYTLKMRPRVRAVDLEAEVDSVLVLVLVLVLGVLHPSGWVWVRPGSGAVSYPLLSAKAWRVWISRE